jgi:copper chaperone CopZ
MTCASCEHHVRDALLSVPSVTSASVDLEAGVAVVQLRVIGARGARLCAAVVGAGYEAAVLEGPDAGA